MKTNIVKRDNISGKFLNVGLKAAYWLISKKTGSAENGADKQLTDQEVISKYAQVESDRVVMFKRTRSKKHFGKVKGKEERHV